MSAVRSTQMRLLSREEAASYLGVSLKAFQEHVQRALMPAAVHIGSRVLFDVREVDEWVEEQKAGGSVGEPITQSFDSVGRGGATGTGSATSLSKAELETLQALRRPPRFATPKSLPIGVSRKPPNSG